MKKSIVVLFAATLLATTLASADQVVEARSDTVVGGGFGGMSGFMLGAAVGGPVGALVGAGVGYFAGHSAQQAAGLEQTLYVIEAEDGEKTRLRTSDTRFAQGEQVQVDGAQITSVSR